MITMLQHVMEITFQRQERISVEKVSFCTYHQEQHKQKQPVQCMKVEEVSNEEDPCDLHFEEIEGHCVIRGSTTNSSAPDYNKPLKTEKYNIGSE